MVPNRKMPYCIQSIRIVILNTSKGFSSLWHISAQSYCRKRLVTFHGLARPREHIGETTGRSLFIQGVMFTSNQILFFFRDPRKNTGVQTSPRPDVS